MPLARCEMLWPLLQAGDRSLDASFDGGPALIDLIRDASESPEALASVAQATAQLEVAVHEALATLPERERNVLKRRYMMSEQSTLEELGRELGVSRERVRQLEERAKTRMRTALQASLLQ
jgi:RNA polymerase sigma-32 factor